jgi:hypothetical protein
MPNLAGGNGEGRPEAAGEACERSGVMEDHGVPRRFLPAESRGDSPVPKSHFSPNNKVSTSLLDVDSIRGWVILVM